MNKKELNIRDLAEITGFSVATVSRALNGKEKGNMTPKTYNKIIETVKKHGYVPNQLSAGLRSGTTRLLGIIFPSKINPYYAMLGHLIEKKAFENGYLTYVCNSDYDTDHELDYIRMLKAQMVAAILMCSTGLSKSVLEKFESVKSPIILLDEEVKNYNGTSITIDDFKGGYIGTEFLLEKQRNNIAFITGPNKLNSTKNRLKGAFSALKDYNFEKNSDNVYTGDYSIQSGKDITKKIFAQNKDIDAIFCFNDQMAIGSSIILRELKIKVPKQTAILGYDNITYTEFVAPSISTIAIPVQEIADIAIDLAINRKSDKPIPKAKFVVSPYLIERESTP